VKTKPPSPPIQEKEKENETSTEVKQEVKVQEKQFPIRAKNPAGSMAEGFIAPEGERKNYHVRIWPKAKFDPETGKQLTQPRLEVFSPREWKQFKQTAPSIGWEYLVLWDPTPYL
jgi:hypothetical protein